tara:strand:- start:244 stop:459 length:216 start_codon:yes stop_codon:yes gene_type:complete
MNTYYIKLFKKSYLSTTIHLATIRSDWTNADWECLSKMFPESYFSSFYGGKLFISDITKTATFLTWYNQGK